jgi:hypothetical protein
MEIHECGGTKSYSFYGLSLPKQCECDHESVNHKDDCCKDKKSIVKGEHKDKVTNKVFLSEKISAECEIQLPIVLTSNIILSNAVNPRIFRSEFPPGNSSPLYILYRNILI